MQCIYYSVFLKLQNACRTVFKEIYSQDPVLEYMRRGIILISYYLWTCPGLSFKLLNFVSVPQTSYTCASNAHLKTLYIIHTITKQIKSFLKGLFYLKSVIFLGLPFLPPNAILRTYVAQPNFNSTYYFDSHWSVNFTFFFRQCDFFWIKDFLNYVRVQGCTRGWLELLLCINRGHAF